MTQEGQCTAFQQPAVAVHSQQHIYTQEGAWTRASPAGGHLPTCCKPQQGSRWASCAGMLRAHQESGNHASSPHRTHRKAVFVLSLSLLRKQHATMLPTCGICLLLSSCKPLGSSLGPNKVLGGLATGKQSWWLLPTRKQSWWLLPTRKQSWSRVCKPTVLSSNTWRSCAGLVWLEH